MKVTICIGSSCHLKGSRPIIEQLQDLVNEHNLQDKVELSGAFCMQNCVNGVSVTVDGEFFFCEAGNCERLFETQILETVK